MGQIPSSNCTGDLKFTEECVDGYLVDFYGGSALWYAPIQFVFNTWIISSDLIFLSVFFSSSTLRSTASNWLLVGLVLTDLFHYTCLLSGAIAQLVGYIEQAREHTLFCEIAGSFVITTGTCSFGFPGIIAAQRFYKVSYMPHYDSKFSVAESIFGNDRLIPLMIIWYASSAALNLPLIIFYQAFGEDPDGYCGAKPFTEYLPFALFLLSILVVFTLSYAFTGIYYFRLGRFLKSQQTTTSNQDSVNFTRSILLMTKIIVSLPLFTMTPTVILSYTQWMLHGFLPLWLKRIICTFYYIPASATPWVALYTLQPFRIQFLKLYFSIRQRFTSEISHSSVRSISIQP